MSHLKNLVKRVFVLFIIVAMAFNGFAAVVSDNDGTAFVTKAEFEDLKRGFDAQIQRYNDSIDRKIDGGIAAYLAGIQIAKKIELDSLLNKVNDSCNDSYKSGSSVTRYGYRCMAKKWTVPTTQKPKGAVTNFFTGNIIGAENDSRSGAGFARIGLTMESRTGLYDINIPASGLQNGLYVMLDKYKVEEGVEKYYPTNVYSNILYRYYVTGSGAAATWDGWIPEGSTDSGVTWTFPDFRITETEYWKIGVDNAYAYWNAASSHTWDFIKVFYGGTYENTESINVVPVTGKISESNIYGLLTENLTRMRLQDDYYDWKTFGRNQFWSRKYSWPDWYEDVSIGVNNEPTLRFYFNCHPYDNAVKPSEFIDYYATKALADEEKKTVAIYGGLPLFRTPSNGEVTVKIKFKSYLNHSVVVGLGKSQFKNDETYTIDSDLNLRDKDNVKYTSNTFDRDKEYVFKLDVMKDDVIWIKTCDASSDTGFTGAITNSILLEEE